MKHTQTTPPKLLHMEKNSKYYSNIRDASILTTSIAVTSELENNCDTNSGLSSLFFGMTIKRLIDVSYNNTSPIRDIGISVGSRVCSLCFLSLGYPDCALCCDGIALLSIFDFIRYCCQ